MLAAALVAAAGGSASIAADPAPAHQRRRDRRRVIHAVAIGGFGLVYLTSELVVKDTLAPKACRWCNPPGLDRDARDALRWADTARANAISNVTGYVLPPLASMGLLVASSWCARSGRRWFDDVAPVLEAAVAVGFVNQVAKFTIGRARPFVRFAPPGREHAVDDDTSFFSGHTSLAFAQAVAAGVVAHRRGYALEPVIWAGGLTLAATTGYLRIAADKHYLTDVLAGAVIGSAFGVVVPYVFHNDVFGENVSIVPTDNGVALSGSF